ncbi:hypothetical protein ADL28_28310 [Streptomyces violaceusniger]|uniref:Uncharacterized protein n=1 Tax=Streptomyces violaceusniger TaxID=68280 RepID=A0A0X3VVG9_STRVO|nr:hypothetical protein ADL28_28310 [Streptomyces violaceusniger]
MLVDVDLKPSLMPAASVGCGRGVVVGCGRGAVVSTVGRVLVGRDRRMALIAAVTGSTGAETCFGHTGISLVFGARGDVPGPVW